MDKDIEAKLIEEIDHILNTICSRRKSCDILLTAERYGMISTSEELFCKECKYNDNNPSKR